MDIGGHSDQRAAAVAVVEVLAREIGVDDPLQMVKVFEVHLSGLQARDRALALVALCVGGMVLARNVGDPRLADDFRRAVHAEVLRTSGWT